MASKLPPVINSGYTFRIVLFAQSDDQIKTTPTIAAGDFKVSTDGGTLANLGTLPTEGPAGSGIVLITLSAGEMNGDEVVVTWIDAAGAEWHSGAATIHTVASGQQFDQLSTVTAAAVRTEMDSNSTQLAAIVADTNELQTDDVPGLIAALNDLSAAAVNAEVVDALATDTYAEPSGVPGATIALTDKIGYLYMALRNKVTVTSTKKTFFDDTNAAEWEKDLTDDGTTYTETEGNAI